MATAHLQPPPLVKGQPVEWGGVAKRQNSLGAGESLLAGAWRMWPPRELGKGQGKGRAQAGLPARGRQDMGEEDMREDAGGVV